MEKQKTFTHKGVKYSLKHRRLKESRTITIMLGETKMGRITTRDDTRAVWVQCEGEAEVCIRTPRGGMRKPEIIRHYMNWVVDKEYIVPDINRPPKVRTDGWQIAVLSDEEIKKL